MFLFTFNNKHKKICIDKVKKVIQTHVHLSATDATIAIILFLQKRFILLKAEFASHTKIKQHQK